MIMVKYLIALIVVLSIYNRANALNYSNATAEQEGNYLVLYYDLNGNGTENAVVGLQIRTKNKLFSTRQLHVDGDVGLVSVGRNKKIYWNVFKDFPKGLPAGSKWSLLVRPTHYTNALGMQFVYIPKGCFYMGATKNDKFAKKDEYPRHKVCVDGFFLGQYEVTNRQFKLFDPSHNSGSSKLYNLNQDKQPVVNVSWDEIQKYTTWLYGHTKEIYRLPTEAEWEYAARAGTKRDTYWEKPQDACKYANIYDTTSHKIVKSYAQKPFPCSDGYVATAPIGKFSPNRFDLYDMIGNAAEWCYDTFYAKSYQTSKKYNPVYLNPYVSLAKSVRGGNWYSPQKDARLSARSNYMPGLITDFIGFRLALEP
jgi:sulfatase modifying factor 1